MEFANGLNVFSSLSYINSSRHIASWELENHHAVESHRGGACRWGTGVGEELMRSRWRLNCCCFSWNLLLPGSWTESGFQSGLIWMQSSALPLGRWVNLEKLFYLSLSLLTYKNENNKGFLVEFSWNINEKIEKMHMVGSQSMLIFCLSFHPSSSYYWNWDVFYTWRWQDEVHVSLPS